MARRRISVDRIIEVIRYGVTTDLSFPTCSPLQQDGILQLNHLQNPRGNVSMSTPHLYNRWIETNGELAIEPRTKISLQDDLIVGLEKFARVFRPGKVEKLSIRIEGWEDEIHVRWGWRWEPSAFVGGIAYRFAFNGSWCPWTVDHSYGYAPGKKPNSDGMGIAIPIQEYGVMFEVEVVLLGLCCMSRGPVTKLSCRIPPKQDIPDKQPALLLNEMVSTVE